MNPNEPDPRSTSGSSTPPALPDFSKVGTAGPRRPSSAPGLGGAESTADVLNSRSRKGPSKAAVISVVVGGIVAIVLVGLFVSQVLLRSVAEDPLASNTGTNTVQTKGNPQKTESTWMPEKPQDPPPAIFTQSPTVNCTMSGKNASTQQKSGYISGGGLTYKIPSRWTTEWFSDNVPYLYDTAGQGKHVEASWYSAVTVGRIDWPKSDGAYPGTEQMAVNMFQCYATHSNVVEQFGKNPRITNYRSEATTVDGTPAWIVQATYHFDPNNKNGQHLTTTSASVVTAIVVETSGGPSALVSDVAADHPDHVAGLEAAIASLKVSK